jgi:hypothetical protein
MKPASIACVILFLAATLFAQSKPVSPINQDGGFVSPIIAPQLPSKRFGAAAHHNPTAPTSGPLFAPAVSYASGGYYGSSAAVADVNGDGKPDLVVANQCARGCNGGALGQGAVGVLLGNGDGTFLRAAAYDSGGFNGYAVAVADVNGDGKPDLLATIQCSSIPCSSDSRVGVLLGNGNGTFQAAVTYDSGGYVAESIAVRDVNGDGKPDIVVANQCVGYGNCSNGGGVGVLLGNGDGTFQKAVGYDSDGIAESVAVADVNGDGKPDIVVANYCVSGCADGTNSTVGILLGNGDGTFEPVVIIYSGGYASPSVAVADVNGDGKPDIAVSDQCTSGNLNSGCIDPEGVVSVLLGNGDGSFQAAVTYGTGGASAYSMAVADVNEDGKPDLVVANGCADSGCSNNGVVGVLLGNGDGTFQAAVTYDSGGRYALSVAVADVNRDGKPDIVVANDWVSTNNLSGIVGVLLNISSLTTTTLASSLNPSNFGQSVTFTATVTSGLKGTPTGTVSFFDTATGTNLGTSSLNVSAVATLQTSALGPSVHTITATYSGDTNFPASVSFVLSQVVLGAAAKLSPASLAFADQTVNTTSLRQSVTLKNTGDTPLIFTYIMFSGTGAASFHQVNNCGTALAGGASCVISVAFRPVGAGAASAALTLSDNAPSKLQKVPVSGIGVLPAVTFSPTSLTFPTQVIDTTSKAQTVTLTNSGAGLLNISNFAASAQFSQTNNCGSTVAPAGSCTLTVKFEPTGLDTITGSISVTDNALVSPQALPLTGVGTAIQLTPIGLSFGNQPVGTKSLAKTVSVSNKSHQTINMSGIQIRGADPSDFSFISTTCGASLSSGASCFIKVAFMPMVTGKRTATIAVSDDGGGEIQRAGLAGTGT